MYTRGFTVGLTTMMLTLATGVALAASPAPAAVKKDPKCDLPFPNEAFMEAPAGFNGTAIVLISFNVNGEFRSGRLMRSSGNEALDDAALRAAVKAKCEPLGDVNNPDLQKALIGIPFAYTFDNTRGSGPAQTTPIR